MATACPALFCALHCVFFFVITCRFTRFFFVLIFPFFCFSAALFSTLRIRRVCVCAAAAPETRQLTKRVLCQLLLPACLSSSPFVQLSAPRCYPLPCHTLPPSHCTLQQQQQQLSPPASFIVIATNAGHACCQCVYYATDCTGCTEYWVGKGEGDRQRRALSVLHCNFLLRCVVFPFLFWNATFDGDGDGAMAGDKQLLTCTDPCPEPFAACQRAAFTRCLIPRESLLALWGSKARLALGQKISSIRNIVGFIVYCLFVFSTHFLGIFQHCLAEFCA